MPRGRFIREQQKKTAEATRASCASIRVGARPEVAGPAMQDTLPI
jgi:hypothetical protein